MLKRIMAMLMALLLTGLLAAPAALAEDEEPSPSEGYYYVYTENGKGLNVRDTRGGKVVGSLKYGSRIYCYYNDGAWALIDYSYNKPDYGYGTYACFVSSRFLRKSKPAPRNSSGTQAASTPSAAASGNASDMNQIFRSAKKVTPYAVTVRPTRVSGWVNMLWAPSKESEILATYKANDQLLVIYELNEWYQVEDQDTGNVGFINKQFVLQ